MGCLGVGLRGWGLLGGAIEVVPVLRLPKHGRSEKFVCGGKRAACWSMHGGMLPQNIFKI